MIAYVDGGSRGNPGPAGVGVMIEHPTGRRVEISQAIGVRGGVENRRSGVSLPVAV